MFFAVIFVGVAILAVSGYAQDQGQRPSPAANANCSFADGKTVTVAYSSPRAKGRKIYGGLVPYGKVWRAGANEATTLTMDTDTTIGDKTIPAGTYTIFTIPNEDKWTMIINKTTKNAKGGPLWGVPYPGEESDFARVDMKASKLSLPVERCEPSRGRRPTLNDLPIGWDLLRQSDIGGQR